MKCIFVPAAEGQRFICSSYFVVTYSGTLCWALAFKLACECHLCPACLNACQLEEGALLAVSLLGPWSLLRMQ